MTDKYSNNFYNKNLKEHARQLRNNSTLPETIIWNRLLKKKQLRGYSFLRQRPIGNYIVDFFSKDLKLIIEIDGEIHEFQKTKDRNREKALKELGYTIIRFKNEQILNEFINVIRTLEEFVNDFERIVTPQSPQGDNY
jgi:very-short-patch-repair endonuclease